LGGRRGAVVVRNADADEIWKVEDAHSGRVDCVAFSPEGSLIASASKADGYVCIWRAGGGDRLWRAADDSVSAAFINREMFVTSKSLYRARDGKRIAALDGVGPVAASADGRFAFVAGEENEGVLYYIPGLSARE
jgi:WD40 repeat protein